MFLLFNAETSLNVGCGNCTWVPLLCCQHLLSTVSRGVSLWWLQALLMLRCRTATTA